MEFMGCASRDDCSSRGSRGRCGRGCRRAWWPSARREDVRRPCRTRSRPCTTCHARGGRGDPAADSPKVSRRRGQHTQAMQFEASAAPQERPEAGARAPGVVHTCTRAVLHARSMRISHCASRMACTREVRQSATKRCKRGKKNGICRSGDAGRDGGGLVAAGGPLHESRRRDCRKIRRAGPKNKSRNVSAGTTSRRP